MVESKIRIIETNLAHVEGVLDGLEHAFAFFKFAESSLLKIESRTEDEQGELELMQRFSGVSREQYFYFKSVYAKMQELHQEVQEEES